MTTATEITTGRLADILDKALKVIETNGWHRGYLYDGEQAEEGTALRDCRVCTLGAINMAVCGTPVLVATDTLGIYEAVELADAAAIAVARNIWVPAAPRAVAFWNDELARTQDDVVQALYDTAAELRAEAAV